ncbi:MAG: YciI family protein [Myxococcota bacterium]
MPHFIYFIHPTRPEMITSGLRDEEKQLLGEHFAYLKELRDRGVVLLAGPSTDPPYTGIVVFKAQDTSEARRIMHSDPAVEGGVFEARLSAFKVSLI